MSSNEFMSVVTVDATGRYWTIPDATPPKIDNTENGFGICQFNLLRPFGFSWPDIGLNFQLFIFSKRGDYAWHGRLDTIEPGLQTTEESISVNAVGYFASVFDGSYSGTLSTSATPEAMITSLFSGSYLPQIASVSLYTTGLTGRAYQTPNGGTDNERPGEIIQNICELGDNSSPVKRVIPAVWNDRQLITYAVATQSPVADYILPRKFISSLRLRRALSSVYTRTIIRYKDTSGTLQRDTVNNTTQQTALGVDFTGGGSPSSFIRTYVMDISGLNGGTSSAVATAAANARLNKVSRVTNDSDSIVINTDYSVFSVAENQEVPMWKVRAGKWLQVPDLMPRPGDSGSGTSAGDASLSTLFYITQASYDSGSGTLTLTPETSSELAKVVS